MNTTLICIICASQNSKEEIFSPKCDHKICWNCLNEYVICNLAPKIKCPSSGCAKFLSDNGIRKVLSNNDIFKYEQLMFTNFDYREKCLLPECSYFIICMNKEVQYDCPECSMFNCLSCNAPHKFISCSQFKTDEDAQQFCDEEISRAKKHLKLKNNVQILNDIDESDVLIYDKLFECTNCCRNLSKNDGVILRCSHIFCRYCLINHILNSKVPILCPSYNCQKPLQEREIIKLIPEEDLKIYFDKCNSAVKGKLNFIFHCQTQDCPYFIEFSTKPLTMYCTICKVYNCTKCYVSHPSESCDQFRNRIRYTPYGTYLFSTEAKIKLKELMRCLKCHHILKKIAGCSWIQCSNCNFEMCWALQIRRWGPKGRDDISDGCKCGVNNKYCAPNCGSCTPHN